MLVLAGEGARKARIDLHLEAGQFVNVEVASCGIHIAQQYKHLGGIVTADGKMAREVARRKADYRKALGPLRATVFRQPRLPPEHKVTFTDSLVTAALLHNAAT